MRLFWIMRRSRPRRTRLWEGRASRRARAATSFERVSLQLQVLVAMANADGQLRASEYERLHAIADRLSTADTRERVTGQMQMLLAAPPTEEDVLRTLIAAGGAGRMTRQLLDDITELAGADARFDVREERLLRLMSAIGGARPMSFAGRGRGAELTEGERELLDRLEREVAEAREQSAARLHAARDVRGDAAA